MIWLALFVAVVVAVVTAAAVLGRVDGSLADATSTMSHVPLPEDRLTPADIDELRFDTAARGYRMSQVDAVIDRLRREIGELDDEVTRLRDGGTPTTREHPEGSETPTTALPGAPATPAGAYTRPEER